MILHRIAHRIAQMVRPDYEPEHTEPVEHDIVIEILPDGTAVDRTEGEHDPEIRE